MRAVYVAFRKRGIDVDILSPHTSDFTGYDIVAIPALFAWNEALRTAIGNFDGHLLLGPRTGSKTANFSLPVNLPPDLPQTVVYLTYPPYYIVPFQYPNPVTGKPWTPGTQQAGAYASPSQVSLDNPREAGSR